MLRTTDIAWLGGLLEGEGAFMMRNGSPKISLQSTDRDIVERAAALLGTAVGGDGWKPKGKHTYKQVWGCSVHGVRAISWMMTLFQFFGERRQTKIREVLQKWTASKAAPRGSRGTRLMAVCHPDKPRSGNLLCHSCYMREWRRNKAATVA